MPVEPKELKALLISDSHVHGEYLNKLAMWLDHTEKKYDVVIIAGNMANMLNKLRNEPHAEYQASQQVVDTLTFFIEHVKKPVFFLPGNTEPTALYSYGFDVPNAVNVHKRAAQLDEKLVILGLGGSIPVEKDKKDILEGYPYKKDQEFTKELEACLESSIKNFGSDVNIILLTHVGPSESTTTDVHLDKEKVNGGVKGFGELLKKYSDNILCNVHGHSSFCEGLTKPFGPKISIINPGGMVAGHFGELNLFRQPTGNWSVTSVEFHSLP